jgi:hypothetical protein
VKLDELRQAKNRRPFHPYTIVMADGGSIEIKHPDAIAWNPGDHRRGAFALSGDEHH